MRFLFFILLLANVVFLAYAQLGPGALAGGDPQIIGQQLNSEKIRLLASEQVGALTRKPESAKAVAAAPLVCLEWGAFGGADVARAENVLEPLALGARLAQRRQEDITGYWVYMPPLASRQVAAQKAAELKRLGVDEFFILSDDAKWRNAISLGVFKTEEAANSHLAALRAKGVRSAVVGAREAQTGKTWLQLRDAGPALAAKLNELKQDFAGTEVRECAADEKKG